MPTDEEISSKNHDATIVEKIVGKKKILINIDEVGDAFITKKTYPRPLPPVGAKLVVQIKKHDDRWLVSKIISIDDEPYSPKIKQVEPKKSVKHKEKQNRKGQKNEAKNRPNQKPKPKKPKLNGQKRTIDLDDKRSIIIKPGLYATIPYSFLSTDLSINLFTSMIEQEGPILVTLFRDSLPAREFDGEKPPKRFMEQRQLNFMQSLEDKFPNHEVKSFDWPQNYRSQYDNYRSTHPYISYHCRAAAIIYEANQKVSKEKFQAALFESIHDHTLKLSKDRWVIVGDETGTLNEFESNNTNLKSTMCWLAIPPGVSLESLPPNFHCSGNGGNSQYKEGIENLSKHDGILMFTFAYEQGEKVENTTKIGESTHLNFWQDTLPLVLEKISTECNSEVGVDIFVEQVFQLESGLEIIEPIINKFVYENLRFEQLWVISKGEHPWIGYPDALGHCINQTKRKYLPEFGSNFEKIEHSIFERIHKSPYRQKGLTGAVISALINKSRPLHLLQSLYSIEANDLRDYIRPFLLDSIIEARDSLKDSEWQELLQHFKNTAETIEGQHSANLILSGIDIDSILPKFRDEMEQYIFLKSVLGSSNHIGTTKVANKCKAYIDDLLDSGLELSKRETRKLKTLQAGANDNQFDWAHIIDDFDEEQDAIDWDEETQHFLGSQALSRALRNHESDLEIAWAIEEQLTSIRQNDFQYRRRYIYRSELLMQKHDFEEGKRCLEVDFPEKIRISDNESHLNDRYYLASLLKACTLTSSTDNFQEYSKYVIKSLDEKHPSQRIAYWYCRWANEIARTESQTENQIFEACLSHLLSLKSQQFFTKEAPGVILACELIDLNKRGLIEEEHESFLQNVLDNSEVFANEWVSNNPPNEDDWLAPLNFNYR